MIKPEQRELSDLFEGCEVLELDEDSMKNISTYIFISRKFYTDNIIYGSFDYRVVLECPRPLVMQETNGMNDMMNTWKKNFRIEGDDRTLAPLCLKEDDRMSYYRDKYKEAVLFPQQTEDDRIDITGDEMRYHNIYDVRKTGVMALQYRANREEEMMDRILSMLD